MASVFRDNLLAGKIAFLTGGGSGIGQRIAERFAEQGATVAIAGRKQEKLDRAAEMIRSKGGKAATFPLDVRDYAAVAAAVQKTVDNLGAIDIVVCAAAGNFPAPAIGMSANGFKSVIDIDLLGTFNTLRAAYEHLRKPGASIINISAAHAFTAIPFQSHVCAAKAGIDILTKTLAVEWGPAGVRVNCITPGPTDETEGMSRLAPTPELRHKVAESVPLRRFGTKDELADLALFLCSDAASFITGSIYTCDGGHSLTRSGGLGGLFAEDATWNSQR
ncbi:MAG TPA: SDR family oxidoreductase [Bryobacteraceae bacterium]|jgi:NAD(P)-dependent dehydrogenase (short-subunit alcohol dehydrogenase family)|nr:SDR family oxidoreductase [Bryobacteraceae bacterium]